ncbi:MAG: response regulator [Proteobacteria bacterium]|nr:response regulator [Pseudomonadota bacterium]
MGRLSYDTAETLVFDPVAANRAATRAALYSLGFRRIEIATNLKSFADSIHRNPPDLAFCEAQGAGEELCQIIQDIRQGATAPNPFVVIIVTAWDKSTSLVTRVINSGADDLLLRPFSTAQLAQRIETHIERRKGFVVTSEYVGPDRRKDASRPSNVELFEPPNSLKMKAKERLTSERVMLRLDAELRAARELLNGEKLRRDAFQISVLWRLMQDHIPGMASYEAELRKIALLARGIVRRCRETALDDAVDWCESIVAAVEGLQAGVDRNASMHLLGQASLNLNHIVHGEKPHTEILKEVDAVVALIRARLQADTAQAS